MAKETIYLLIHSGEDPQVRVILDKDELLRDINRGHYGDAVDRFLSKDDLEMIGPDLVHWDGKCLLLRAEVLVPRPVEKVTSYKLE
jgi:hypothetical protein